MVAVLIFVRQNEACGDGISVDMKSMQRITAERINMKTEFVIFDRMTALDLIGVYDPLTRLKSMNFVPEFNWQFCAFTRSLFSLRG
jgi:hypothetical protein